MLRTSSRLAIVLIFFATQSLAGPVECLHNGEVIGTSELASVELGTVTCQDPASKIILKETEFKSWMIIREKIYKDGSLQAETSYNGVPGQNKYHGWKNTYSDGVAIREELYEHGTPILQRIYSLDGKLKLATATLISDRSQKSRVEFDDQGNLIGIQCSRAIIGPKQKKWCGLDGTESTVTLFLNGVASRKLSFLDGHLKVYQHLEKIEDNLPTSTPTKKTYERLEIENYSDGRKKSERRRNFSGQLDGLQRHFEHSSQGLVIEELFDEGDLRESRIFYPNGRTKLHFVWDRIVGDKRFGNYRGYFSDGELETKGDCYELVQKTWPFAFDAIPTFLKHGLTKIWDEDGELRERSHWRDGVRHGVSEYYFTRAGKVRMTKASYKHGVSQMEQDFAEDNRQWRAVSERQFKVSLTPRRR